MDGLYVLYVFSGIVSCSHNLISGSVLEVTARPGDNITLYCDCRVSVGVYIVWLRNCSHEKQPTLVLKTNTRDQWQGVANFKFLNNLSSNSYDLLIMNITDSDEGIYYCGTQELNVKNKEYITSTNVYTYSNVTTRIILNSTEPQHDKYKTEPNCDVCWKLLFSLCPAVAVLSSLFSLLVYQFCQKKVGKPQDDEKRHDNTSQGKQGEDVCYAALEIRQPSQRPKRKKTQSSDFSTYSDIKTSKV